MEYSCGKFGDCSFSRFGFIVRTNRQTDRQTDSDRQNNRRCYTVRRALSRINASNQTKDRFPLPSTRVVETGLNVKDSERSRRTRWRRVA